MGELLNNLKDVLQVICIVCEPWFVSIYVLVDPRRVHIKHEIDTSSGEHRHTDVMIQVRVD